MLHSIPLASGLYASRSTLKLRPVYLHSMWCPSTSVQHCAPYRPGGRFSARYADLAFSAHTQVAVAHPWGRSCHSSAAPSPGNSTTSARLTFTPAFIQVTSHLQRNGVIHTHCRCCSLNPTQARCLLHLAAVPLTLGTFQHRTAGTFPVPSFGHHSIGPQRRTGRGVFTGVDRGPAIRLCTVGPEAPRRKVPRRLAGLGSLPRFSGVLLPFLCQANKRL